MTREDSRLKRDAVVALYRRGKPLDYCARIVGYSKDYVRQILTRAGLWEIKSSVVEKKEQQIIAMLNAGQKAKDIAYKLGYSSTTSIYNIAHKYGIRKNGTPERDAAMRQYKSEGHTHREVAEKFGVSGATATLICKGIAPQTPDYDISKTRAQEQHQKTLADREAKARETIESKYDNVEYAGGFTNSDSSVRLRCKKCGTVFERSMVTIRHHDGIVCPRCVMVEKVEALMAKADKREQAEKLRNCIRAKRKLYPKEKEAQKIHPCPVCGEITTRKKYCSVECSRKAANAMHEAKRRARVESALVDKDITLEKLYKRDHGICYLCGEKCDWEDKEERDGTIICGDRYPSVEHVIPLSKGGEHSWENVRLAHRICNIRKRDRVPSTTSSLTTSKSRTAVSVSVNG